MTNAMEALFNYAQEHMVTSLLRQERDYANVRRRVEKRQESFFASLSGSAQEHFDDLLDEQNLLSALYGRALFRAGFQLAMELAQR